MTADPRELLRRLAGPEARFRPGQLEAVLALVQDRRRVLCVQRTGWGKSAVYFLATALLRAAGAGPTVLISPLLALMRNQLDAAGALGLRAATLNSSNVEEWGAVERALAADAVDLLLVSPERLGNPGFRADVLPAFVDRIGLLVVDEAHCISDWGHDFRPDYRRIAPLLEQLPADAAVLCTTATANDRVIADVAEQLGRAEDLLTLRGTLDRPALRLEVVELPGQAQRLAWLAEHLPELPGSGIVYCLTVRDAEVVAAWLRGRGLAVEAYHGEMESARREDVERRLLAGDVKAVVATSALGMGYDKPDLGFVVHFQGPASPVAYYQQVGRAGRALAHADAVLLRGREDREIQDFFIDVAFPDRERVQTVMDRLEEAGAPVSVPELLGSVNLGRGRLEGMLKTLEVDGIVRRAGRGWVRTGAPWTHDEARAERVTAERRREQAAMERYARGGDCLMRFLRAELDDPLAEPCGRCAVCAGPRFAAAPAPALVAEAVEHLRGRPIAVRARRQWPMGSGLGRIPAGERVEDGRALALPGDGGWGTAVRAAARAGGYGEDVVAGCADLLARWRPDPAPAWVTAVPPARRADHVTPLARRLAAALGVPFQAAVRRVGEGPPQREMANANLRHANVRAAFAVAEPVPSGPVLLVDDLVDSGWTMTVVGRLLRRAGAPAVHPFALTAAPGRA